ncbi:hypothetical protein RMCBS344292_14122 [Rhizopus microsporus]|nr:hypothetical protein RMCBS344292_14122 [Rhizopus microsporus]
MVPNNCLLIFLDAEEITEQEMANDADDGNNDVELKVAVVIESSQQNEENTESDDEDQNVDRFKREMANLETNPNGIHEARATEGFATDDAMVEIPGIIGIYAKHC